MTMAVPAQEFQIGQRVRVGGQKPFVITAVSFDAERFLYAEFLGLDTWYRSSNLTLAPERLLYVPSERLVIGRDNAPRASIGYLNSVCRCETDAELAARHAVERAEYDAQGDET